MNELINKPPLNGAINYTELVAAFDELISYTPRSLSFDRIRLALETALEEYTDTQKEAG